MSGRRLLPAAAALLVLSSAAWGCGGPEVRRAPTNLKRDAQVLLERDGRAPLRLARDSSGYVTIPVEAGTQRLRVEEPRKPPLLVEVDLRVDPRPAEEDALHLRSSANLQVVRKRRASGVTGAQESLVKLYPEPLSLLRDPYGGIWSLPREGQGLVIVADRREAEVELRGRTYRPRPLAGGSGTEQLVLRLQPGPVRLKVGGVGLQPWEADPVEVPEGAYRLLAVRLVEERRP